MIKDYLPSNNILLCIAKEDYIIGFDNQSHFRTLKHNDVKDIIEKVNRSKSKHKIYILDISQNDVKYLVEKIKFTRLILVRGSWHKVFHTNELFYRLVNNLFQRYQPLFL